MNPNYDAEQDGRSEYIAELEMQIDTAHDVLKRTDLTPALRENLEYFLREREIAHFEEDGTIYVPENR